jgi:hypothetical protein
LCLIRATFCTRHTHTYMHIAHIHTHTRMSHTYSSGPPFVQAVNSTMSEPFPITQRLFDSELPTALPAFGNVLEAHRSSISRFARHMPSWHMPS